MKKLKATYERPTTDVLVIRFEDNILSFRGANSTNHTEYLGEEEDGGLL